MTDVAARATTTTEAVGWDGLKFNLTEGFGVDNALRAYVRHIMGRLDLDVSPPPVGTIDTSVLWGTSGTELVPVDSRPIGAPSLRTGGSLAFGPDAATPLASIGYEIATQSIVYAAGDTTRAAGDTHHRFEGGVRVDDLFIGTAHLHAVPHSGSTTAETLRLDAPNGYVTASGAVGVILSANVYWDGGVWHAYDPAAASADFVMHNNYLAYRTAPAGDPAALSTALRVDSNGTLVAAGSIVTEGDFQMPAAFPNSDVRISWYAPHTTCYFDVAGNTAFRTGAGGAVFADKKFQAPSLVADSDLTFSNTSQYLYSPGGTSIIGTWGGLFANQGFYWESGLTVRSVWDGASVNYTHQISAPYYISRGNIDIQGGYIYFRANAGLALYHDGAWIHGAQNFITDGDRYAYVNNGGIFTNWDGVGINHSHEIRGPSVYVSGAIYCGTGLRADSSVWTHWASFGWDYSPSHAGWQFLMNHSSYGNAIANQWSIHSARRYKDHIEPISNALAIVTNPALHGVSYDRVDYTPSPVERTRGMTVKHEYGFVADDWQAVEPTLVGYDEDGSPMGMDYDRVGAITFEAVKELAAQVEAQNARIAALEAALQARG